MWGKRSSSAEPGQSCWPVTNCCTEPQTHGGRAQRCRGAHPTAFSVPHPTAFPVPHPTAFPAPQPSRVPRDVPPPVCPGPGSGSGSPGSLAQPLSPQLFWGACPWLLGLFVMGGHRDSVCSKTLPCCWALLVPGTTPGNFQGSPWKLTPVCFGRPQTPPQPPWLLPALCPCSERLSPWAGQEQALPWTRALAPCPGSEAQQGCHSRADGEAETGTKECSCCSNKEQ